MKRLNITPRPNLRRKLEERGMLYHEGYYTETAAYRFSLAEIEALERASIELFDMCLKVVQHVIDRDLWAEFFIPAEQAELIRRSWNEDDVSLYGRFDLGYNSTTGEIKLLEFNADTPTSLLEASVIQWDWKEECHPDEDQWNSIHERLVAHFKYCTPYLARDMHFACVREHAEDYMNTAYMAECARQAGYDPQMIYIDQVSIDHNHGNRLCTPDAKPIQSIFKLYPWEWLFHERFAGYLYPNYEQTTWVEPPYKAILSNKMLLVYLWKLFPGHRLLLESHYRAPEAPFVLPGRWVLKPVYGREGANVSVYDDLRLVEQREGDYGEEGFVAQRFFEIERFGDMTPVLGSWLIAGESAGMGIREQAGSLITSNMAQFAPHFIG